LQKTQQNIKNNEENFQSFSDILTYSILFITIQTKLIKIFEDKERMKI